MSAACKYPNCSNHKEGAAEYCCNGCRWDHEDSEDRGPGDNPDNWTIYDWEANVVIDDVCLAFSEKWFERMRKIGLNEFKHPTSTLPTQSWLCLFNGAFLATDKDTGPRYEVYTEKWDDTTYLVIDRHTLEMRYASECKYLVIAKCWKKVYADRIVRALNRMEPV